MSIIALTDSLLTQNSDTYFNTLRIYTSESLFTISANLFLRKISVTHQTYMINRPKKYLQIHLNTMTHRRCSALEIALSWFAGYPNDCSGLGFHLKRIYNTREYRKQTAWFGIMICMYNVTWGSDTKNVSLKFCSRLYKKKRKHTRTPTVLTLSENKNTPATQIFPRGQRADCVSLLITPFPLGICIQSFKCQTNILNYACVPL